MVQFDGVLYCDGVVYYALAWCAVVRCGVVWYGMVWCGDVWCVLLWSGVVCQSKLQNHIIFSAGDQMGSPSTRALSLSKGAPLKTSFSSPGSHCDEHVAVCETYAKAI